MIPKTFTPESGAKGFAIMRVLSAGRVRDWVMGRVMGAGRVGAAGGGTG